jgi:hypothetical protein
MSKVIARFQRTGSRDVEIEVVRYTGPNQSGCLQLSTQTQEGFAGYIQVTADDLVRIMPLFQKFIKEENERRRKKQ